MTGLASGLATRPATPGSKLRSHVAEWLGGTGWPTARMARLGRKRIPSGKGMAGWLAGTAGLLAGQLPGGLGGARGGSPAGNFPAPEKENRRIS